MRYYLPSGKRAGPNLSALGELLSNVVVDVNAEDPDQWTLSGDQVTQVDPAGSWGITMTPVATAPKFGSVLNGRNAVYSTNDTVKQMLRWQNPATPSVPALGDSTMIVVGKIVSTTDEARLVDTDWLSGQDNRWAVQRNSTDQLYWRTNDGPNWGQNPMTNPTDPFVAITSFRYSDNTFCATMNGVEELDSTSAWDGLKVHWLDFFGSSQTSDMNFCEGAIGRFIIANQHLTIYEQRRVSSILQQFYEIPGVA